MSGRLGVAMASARARSMAPATASPVAPSNSFHSQPPAPDRAAVAEGAEEASGEEGAAVDEGVERAM